MVVRSTPSMPTVSRGLALAVLALVSATTVAAEVLLTRALSVTTWYGLAFVVLSLAMLGLTRGSLDADAASRAREPIAPWIARRLLALAVGLAITVGVVVSVAGLAMHYADRRQNNRS